ncbi:hypothetical protein C804_03265 [Lachnospiraceae bacterium A4]|nr:hypothetical protein C804_03265 [Lachnospiraceae bacterium A4]
MRITIIEPEDGEEDEIMIRCRHLDKRLLKLIYAIKAGETVRKPLRGDNRILNVGLSPKQS